jgi:hypothetical protein
MSELITLYGTCQLRWSAVVDLFPYLGKRARSLAEPSPTASIERVDPARSETAGNGVIVRRSVLTYYASLLLSIDYNRTIRAFVQRLQLLRCSSCLVFTSSQLKWLASAQNENIAPLRCYTRETEMSWTVMLALGVCYVENSQYL